MFTAGSYGSIVLGSACIEATKAGASSSNLDFLQTKKKIPVFHHHHLNVLFLFALRRKRRSMCAANSAPLIRRRERPWSARDATPLHTSNVLALYTAPITSVTSAKAKVADVALDFSCSSFASRIVFVQNKQKHSDFGFDRSKRIRSASFFPRSMFSAPPVLPSNQFHLDSVCCCQSSHSNLLSRFAS
jgi:hypothetical protein